MSLLTTRSKDKDDNEICCQCQQLVNTWVEFDVFARLTPFKFHLCMQCGYELSVDLLDKTM